MKRLDMPKLECTSWQYVIMHEGSSIASVAYDNLADCERDLNSQLTDKPEWKSFIKVIQTYRTFDHES